MNLGTFSLSLAVQDLNRSLEFYSKLGFEKIAGDSEGYVIVKNGATVIGLFQGMFENNMLTFNPGWDGPQQEANPFTDVREIEERLSREGIEVESSNTKDSSQGPAHVVVVDPDGNPILIDQHR